MTADTTDVTEEMETTIRIAVSLRWGDAFDADIARQIAEHCLLYTSDAADE